MSGAPNHAARPSTFRVVLVTQEDPLYLPHFFETFFAERAQREGADASIEICGLMIQRALGNKTAKGLAKRILGLYGPIGFVRLGVRTVWARLWRRTVAGVAGRNAVPLLPFEDANGDDFVRFVRDQAIDLVVSVSASQIFRATILEAPRCGCINLHNAPLPRYRGMLPNFWQMLHDEQQSVLTIHTMVAELDKGQIVRQVATPILPDMSLDDLIVETKRRSARVLWDVLHDYAAGTIELTPMSSEPGSYFSFPTQADARAFRAKGKRLL